MKKCLLILVSILGLVGCQSSEDIEMPQEEVTVPVQPEEKEELVLQVMFQLDELPTEELMTLTYLGRDALYDIYYSMPYAQYVDHMDEAPNGLMFYFTNPSTFEVIKTGEMEPVLAPKIKLIDNNITILKTDSIIQISNHFDDVTHVQTPFEMATAYQLYGYDVSDDLTAFVYSTQDGLWYLNAEMTAPVLLLEPYKFAPNPLIEFGYYVTPTFINDFEEVIVDVGGYEGSMGYQICDLKTLTCDAQPSGTQQDLIELQQNKEYLQLATSTGEVFPWRYHWVNLKTKVQMDELPMNLEAEAGFTRRVDDYLQLDDVMYVAIGTRAVGKFLPTYIDIESYHIQADGTLTLIKEHQRVEDIALTLLGATPEGKVIYTHEDYDPATTSGELKLYMTE